MVCNCPEDGGHQPQREPLRELGLLSSSISARTWVPKHSDFKALSVPSIEVLQQVHLTAMSCPLTILWFGPSTLPESTIVAFRHGDCSYVHQPLHTPHLPRRGLHGYSWRKWRPLSSCYLVHSTTELQVLRSPALRASWRLIRSLKHCSAESGAHTVDPITTSRTWTLSVLQHPPHPAAVDKSHPVLRSKPLPWTKSKALATSADLLGEKISLTSTQFASKQLQLEQVSPKPAQSSRRRRRDPPTGYLLLSALVLVSHHQSYPLGCTAATCLFHPSHWHVALLHVLIGNGLRSCLWFCSTRSRILF